jgi:heme-degrading monooxygenase HmoA
MEAGMKKIALLWAAALLISASTAIAQEAPVQVAYYYKVRWGFQQEFERLFQRNHYPVLMEMKQRGRVQDVKLFRPTYHLKDDWTFLVVITYPSWAAFDRFQKEEQRRFEILDSHWDVPLTPVAPPK